MYKEFYGLEDLPFTLTPDPRFIVFTPSYNEVLASLYYGLENAKGLIVLTGEVGTGKTTALRWILRRLDSSVLAAYVFNPRLSIDEFYHHVTQMLGIKDWSNKAELLSLMGRVLEERHRRGLRTVLIIDEAHELSDYVLEEIRLLMNFESDNAKHLQIVLTGQPELREKLNQPNLRQLKQRVALRCKIHSLPNVDETERYITERLLIGGSEQPNVFTPGAIDFIFQCSEGIPRQINNLCDNAMLAGYAAGEQIISRAVIEEVADNLDLLPRRENLIGGGGGGEQRMENTGAARVLTDEAREELWNQKSRVEPTAATAAAAKPKMFQTEAKAVNGSMNGAATNGHKNGKYKPFGDLDDEINLEIGDTGGFY
jgi:general secretion pathway protein A